MSDLTRLAPRSIVERLLDAPDLPAEITRLVDLDLWRPDRAGDDARFDAARFAEWLEVLLDERAEDAARILAAMDPAVAAAGIAAYVRVLDLSAVTHYPHTDGELVNPMPTLEADRSFELAGYLIIARGDGPWETITHGLHVFAAEEPASFDAVMRRCRARSHAPCEVDGLDELLDPAGQALADLAIDRDERREAQGYATPADARAFLQQARRARVVAAAATPATGPGPLAPTRRLSRLHDYVAASGAAAEAHGEALARLANALLAGGQVLGRELTPRDASEAASATCTLGLARWPPAQGVPPDLVAAFEVGWTVLYQDVALFAAERLIAVVADLRARSCAAADDLETLQRALTRHWRAGVPWLAREAFDVVALLDAPSWAAIDGLIAECPVLHGAVRAALTPGTRAVDPGAFEFIADDSQIALVRRFLEALPAALAG